MLFLILSFEDPLFNSCENVPKNNIEVIEHNFCLSHRYGTPYKRSTGQMKYCWETLA